MKKWKGCAEPHNTRNHTSLTSTDVKLELKKKTKKNLIKAEALHFHRCFYCLLLSGHIF